MRLYASTLYFFDGRLTVETRKLGVAAAIILMILAAFVPSIPFAFAAEPAFSNKSTCNIAAGSSSCTANTLNTIAGDLLVAGDYSGSPGTGNVGCGTGIATLTAADGTTFSAGPSSQSPLVPGPITSTWWGHAKTTGNPQGYTFTLGANVVTGASCVAFVADYSSSASLNLLVTKINQGTTGASATWSLSTTQNTPLIVFNTLESVANSAPGTTWAFTPSLTDMLSGCGAANAQCIGDTVYSTQGSLAISASDVISDSGGLGNWDGEISVFGPTGTVITTTSTTTNTASTTTFGDGITTLSMPSVSSNTIYFSQGQNPVNSPAVMTNMTGKVSSAKISTSTGTVWLALYVSNTPNTAPSASFPLNLVYQKAYTISNGTTNQLLTDAPVGNSVQVCALCYYAIAFFTTATKSNSVSVTGSGVTMLGGNTNLWYTIAAGNNVLPNQFYTGTQDGVHAYYVWALLKWAVAVATITSTTTVSGTISTTTTITTTSTQTNVINQALPSQAVFWYMPMLFIFLFMGLFASIGLAMKRVRG